MKASTAAALLGGVALGALAVIALAMHKLIDDYDKASSDIDWADLEASMCPDEIEYE